MTGLDKSLLLSCLLLLFVFGNIFLRKSIFNFLNNMVIIAKTWQNDYICI